MYKNFIYNEDKNIIFVYVLKVVCINWKFIFWWLNGVENWFDNCIVYDCRYSGLIYFVFDFG